jgi:chaperonin GroES
MGFIPLGKRVLVKRVEEEAKTASGIIIPDNAKEKPSNGKIISISEKVKEKGLIKEGDTVVFGKYSGTEIAIGGVDHLVMDTNDILGILK